MEGRELSKNSGSRSARCATAAVCARFGMECVVYMGSGDIQRQAAKVSRMRILGAKVRIAFTVRVASADK